MIIMAPVKNLSLLTLCVAVFVTVFAAMPAAGKSFYDFKTQTLKGAPADLGIYKGKVALVVNVASYCGFTERTTKPPWRWQRLLIIPTVHWCVRIDARGAGRNRLPSVNWRDQSRAKAQA